MFFKKTIAFYLNNSYNIEKNLKRKGSKKMNKIVKNKNFLELYINKETPYKFDINTGILYGIKGQPLKNPPKGLKTILEQNSKSSNVINYICYTHRKHGVSYTDFNNYADELKLCDRLDSINYKVQYIQYLNQREIDFINKNFKKFVSWLKDRPEHNNSIDTFVNEIKVEIFLEEMSVQIDEHFTEEMAKWCCRTNFNKEEMRWVIYYLSRGLWEFYENEEYYLEKKLRKYFRYVKENNSKCEKGDFIKNYVKEKRVYELNKKKIDSQKLYENQIKKKEILSFEYENLEVIVPTSAEEFKEEAEQQSNCVARIYLPRVINGELNIVFIRKKEELNKSYITCEVRNGIIYQYLTRFNQTPYEEEAIKFKKIYQEYLNENWE